MKNIKTLGLVALTLSISGLILLAANIGAILRWERENGYPFGQMCNSIFTLYVNTCPGA